MTLKSKFEKMAEDNGLVLSENADRIIKVKERLITFGCDAIAFVK